MEKISSIVQSKSQNKVDMSKERPVRAGAPSYGAPVSEATHTFGKEKIEKENVSPLEAVAIQKLNLPDMDRHVDMIDKITFSFKGSAERPEPASNVVDLNSLESTSQEDGSQEQPQSIDVYA